MVHVLQHTIDIARAVVAEGTTYQKRRQRITSVIEGELMCRVRLVGRKGYVPPPPTHPLLVPSSSRLRLAKVERRQHFGEIRAACPRLRVDGERNLCICDKWQ